MPGTRCRLPPGTKVHLTCERVCALPVFYEILTAEQVIVARPTGRVTDDCILRYFGEVRAHPDYVPGMDRLILNSALVELDMDFDRMRRVRANEVPVIRAAPRRVRTAIFCPERKGFGTARMYQSLVDFSGDHEVGVFETLPETLAFLGHSAALLDRLAEGAQASAGRRPDP